MKIQLDKIELTHRINGLQLKSHFLRDHCDDLYYDTDLEMFVVQQSTEGNSKYTGRVLVPRQNVSCAQVASESVPVHQPIGTPKTHDTPKGTRKKRSVAGSKATLAERIEARAAENKSAD